MITSQACLTKFGKPTTQNAHYMTLFTFPKALRDHIPALPTRIYCHQLLAGPLRRALDNVAAAGLGSEIKTWDGCFNIRWQRRYAGVWSLHSWGLAIDINASTNQLGQKSTMSLALVDCFERAGFDWGGHWRVPDGMHFQLSRL
jgi:hypothetical protein